MIYQGKEASIITVIDKDPITLPLEITNKISHYEQIFDRKINVLNIQFSSNIVDDEIVYTALLVLEGNDIEKYNTKRFIEYCEKKYGKEEE